MKHNPFHKALQCAGHGIGFTFISQRNFQYHCILAVSAIGLGLYFRITHLEWLSLILSISFVLMAELFNTAIEIAVDLTTRKQKYRARLSKDIAAGAVLLSAINALVIGYLIFYHRFDTLMVGG